MLPSCIESPVTLYPVSITSTTATIKVIVEGELDSIKGERGICYSTKPNPTVIFNKIKSDKDLGQFTSIITRLLRNTTYYVRAFVIDSSEYKTKIKYSNQVSFKTQVADLPSIITTEEGHGKIINNGGARIIERGFCFKTTPNPDRSDRKMKEKFGNDEEFVASDLPEDTIYYIRPYATNSVGTAYGNEILIGVYRAICFGNGWQGAAIYNPLISGIHPIHSIYSIPNEWNPK